MGELLLGIESFGDFSLQGVTGDINMTTVFLLSPSEIVMIMGTICSRLSKSQAL